MKSFFVAVLLPIGMNVGAQAPNVTVSPTEAMPGAIVRLSLSDAPGRTDAIVSARGTLLSEPLRFLATDSGRFHAIGGISTEASDSVSATVFATRASGAVDTIRVSLSLAHPEVPKTESKLAVAERFTRPLDAQTQARIARENARAREVGRRSHDSHPLWTEEFLKPRETRITSEFGTGRMFNGKVASRHLGVDYAGDVGAAVRAANRGVVALVDTFFLAGRLVYIDHGGGVVTGYFHLSKPLVAKGDTVTRGQVIGLVGATGRVTGPHLHWSARYGALTVNPGDLLTLDEDWYSGALAKPRVPGSS
jgi:murein DD-endopeptidase MepM/ murein hydrolase activator NlpD